MADKARLDIDGNAAPKTRLIGHAHATACIMDGVTVTADALENTATGERTSLAAEIDATMPHGSDIDAWSYIERAALRLLSSHGVTDLRTVVAYGWTAETSADAATRDAARRKRFTVWLAESMVWTIREIRAGRNREALRGLLQVADYCGRLGGFWPSTALADGYSALRNHFEDLLRGAQ